MRIVTPLESIIYKYFYVQKPIWNKIVQNVLENIDKIISEDSILCKKKKTTKNEMFNSAK